MGKLQDILVCNARCVACYMLFVVGVLIAPGCCCHQKSADMGWRFEVVRPPVIHTEMPMLVQSGPGLLSAQPLGGAVGPIAAGTWQQAGGLEPAQAYARPVIVPQPLAAPCVPQQQTLPAPSLAPQRQLTCEEWCELMKARGVPLPAIPPPDRMPKGKD